MPENQLPRDTLATQLAQGLELSGQKAEAHPIDTYLDYIQLLVKWNQAYNLSGIKQPEKMVSYHILDSLSALPYLQGNQCLDVGTGAGLPGFILALADPSRQWVLLDSNNKKVRFLNQAVLELKPDNVQVIDSRVEDFKAEQLFTTIISRAMSSLPNLKKSVSRLISPQGRLIAMKGVLAEEEKRLISADFDHILLESVQVPGVDAERNLVIQSQLTV